MYVYRFASRVIQTDFGIIVAEQRLLATMTTGLVPLLPTPLRESVVARLEIVAASKRLEWLESLVSCQVCTMCSLLWVQHYCTGY